MVVCSTEGQDQTSFRNFIKKLYTIILKSKGIIIYIPRSCQLSGHGLNMPETDPGSVVFCFNCSPATYNLIISLQNDPIK